MLCRRNSPFFFSVFLSVIVICVHGLRIEVDEDPRVQSGRSVELVCKAKSVRNEIDRCYWYGPDQTRYSARDSEDDSDNDDDEDDDDGDDRNTRRRTRTRGSRSSNVEATLYVDDEECVLKINSVSAEHNGPWECYMEERSCLLYTSDAADE